MSYQEFTINYIKYFIYIALVFLFQQEVQANWKTERESLDHVYTSGKFRLFYTLEGKHALADITDKNKNNIPDIIEDTAIQLNVANRLFSEVFQLTQPDNNIRYKNKLQFIDTHFLLSTANGSSGDALIKYDYKKVDTASAYSLSILISTKIKTGNLTPAHELFHAYQNGYTLFKNRWFTEGTARWVEYAFKPGTGEQDLLPQNQKALEQLLEKTYDAKYFWNRLTFLCKKSSSQLDLPTELTQAHYITRVENVIEGKELYGYRLILDLLNNLQQFDDISAIARGLDQNHWKEKEQKSPKNNKYILMALKQSIINLGCEEQEEVGRFLAVINHAINRIPAAKPQAISSQIEFLGNPYQDYYQTGEHIYSRNIWDMQFYDNKLFIGAGNASNSQPSPNSGPVPIISYNPENRKFSTEGKVDDEQIDRFKIINQQLYIPGFDAKENHKWGNYYRRGKQGHWEKKRNIPKGLHIFDMASFENKLFAGILSSKGAAVTISDNKGESWKTHFLGDRQRVYDLFKVGDKLYAVKQFLSFLSVNKLPDIEQRKNYFSVAEWRSDQFIQRPGLTRDVFFPDISLNKERTLRVSRTIQLDNKVVYLAAYNYNVPFGFFIASSLQQNKIDIKHIKLDPEYKPRDMLYREGLLYLLCSKKDQGKYRIVVFKVNIDSLSKLEKVLGFSSPVFARSFEEQDGDFYFGMGVDVRNKRIWKQQELKPETGNIMKVKSGYFQK